jgi:dolichol-phosphate mannosyltransferase
MRGAVTAFHRWASSLSRFHALAGKLVRFGIVGTMSATVFLVATALLAGSVNLEPKIASAVGYIVSMPVNFLGNRQFSFKSEGTLLGDLLRFLSLHGCNILLTMGAMGAAVNVLQLHFELGAIAAIMLVPLVNFAVMDLWVFRRGPNGLPARSTE